VKLTTFERKMALVSGDASTDTKCTPVKGSIQWAMDRGKLFQVDGINKYGQLVTNSETPEEAANVALYQGEQYCVWVPPGTVLTVWNVYAGSVGGFQMQGKTQFVVRDGKAVLDCPREWKALERAVFLAYEPLDHCADFMFMGEGPAGTFRYKHRGTRNYANLRMDSTAAECVAELARANSNERTWGKAFDFQYGIGVQA